MTAFADITLRCDVWDCDEAITLPLADPARARTRASNEGWASSGTLDLCPVHQKGSPS